MCNRDNFEVHAEYTAYHCSRRQQTGYNRHHFHHFIHAKVHIAEVEVLQVHHHITIVLYKFVCLYNVVVHIFKIFRSTFLQQITITSDEIINDLTNGTKIPF